ncbi:glycosyltransferase family 2 protein [Aliiroseovarius sp.]|uniref:glycosyltransferase family 2 protein n=1 Tax=Aliiroseovarius sp. TaxID=1872442 RepID=UPI0026178CB8|nr:glycosyltransferase family 2 protein [Aliiroseovarius sp.]
MYMHPIHPRPGLDVAVQTGAIRQRTHVCILLCTFNGSAFLQEQLDSFLAQDHRDWSLWISDDHSTDATRRILQDFILAHPDREVRLFDGVGRGHAANYLSLLCRPALPSDCFIALSDQDDVWLPDRLSRGLVRVAACEMADDDAPVLYGSRTRLVDEDLTPMGLSRGLQRPPSFGNALVQNVMAGNTLLLNPAALALVRRAGPGPDVPFHDWWLYLLLSGAGARLVFDEHPTVLYRQHERNALGTPNTLRGSIKRLDMVRRSVFRQAINRNLAALERHGALLSPAHRQNAAIMARRGQGSRLRALRDIWRAGVRRQGRMQSLFVFWAMMRRMI